MSRIDGRFQYIDVGPTDNTLVGLNMQEVMNRLHLPTLSQKPTYNLDGSLHFVDYYRSSSQVESNRTAQSEITYNANKTVNQEIWRFYSHSDGTTVLKTVTKTYTWSGQNLTNVTQVVT